MSDESKIIGATRAGSYALGRSIIHKCPALLMPQSLTESVGATRQIVPLKGLTESQARFIVDACNAALAA